MGIATQKEHLRQRINVERMVPGMIEMAQSEWDHEAFLYERCAAHWLSRVARPWSRPGPRPPKEESP